MLTPDELEEYSWEMLGGAQAVLSSEMLRTILRYYALSCTLSPSDRRRLMELSTSQRREIDAILAAYNPVVGQQAVELTYDLLETSNARDASRLADHYRRPASDLSEESRQAAVGVAMIVERDNVSMGDNANRLWYEVSAWTTTEYATGTKSLDEIIAQGVEELLAHGLDSVQYVDSDGNLTVRNSVDVAIRRHAMTQANQAAARMTLEHMEEFGHDLVQTTAHMGARPTHEVWQGRAFSLSGERTIDGVTYPDFYAETGYGTVQGLCGANCRHQFYPHFPGDPLPPRPDTEESNRQYKESQKQRRLEREIRKAKKEAAGYELAAEEATDPAVAEIMRKKAEEARMRVGSLQAQMREHVKENDFLVRQSKREKAYGIGKQPTALKARRSPAYSDRNVPRVMRLNSIGSFESTYRGANEDGLEYGMVFDRDGNELFDKPIIGKEHSIEIPLPEGYTNWRSLQVAHTHPDEYGGTFSSIDISSFVENRPLSTRAICSEGTYILAPNPSAQRRRWVVFSRNFDKEFVSTYNKLADDLAAECLERGTPATYEERRELRNKTAVHMDSWLAEAAEGYGFSYEFIPS